MTAPCDEIPVGVLLSHQTASESAILQGTLLGIAAVNDAGGVLGRKISPVVCDPCGRPERAVEIARRLILEREITHLFGGSYSFIRKALIPVVERHNALLWYPTQFEGFELSTNIIYGGACPNQTILPLIGYLLSKGHEAFFLIGSDYIYPRETNRVARQLIEAAGGRVVGERYVSLHAEEREIRGALEALPASDAIFSTVMQPTGLKTYSILRELGVRSTIASTASEIELGLAPEILEGHVCAAPYFESIGDSSNLSFLATFHRRFGDKARASWLSASAFMQMLLFAETAEQAGSLDIASMMGTIGNGQIEGPFGRYRIDPETNYTFSHSRVAVANRRGHFDIVHDTPDAVRPDPFMVEYA